MSKGLISFGSEDEGQVLCWVHKYQPLFTKLRLGRFDFGGVEFHHRI